MTPEAKTIHRAKELKADIDLSDKAGNVGFLLFTKRFPSDAGYFSGLDKKLQYALINKPKRTSSVRDSKYYSKFLRRELMRHSPHDNIFWFRTREEVIDFLVTNRMSNG